MINADAIVSSQQIQLRQLGGFWREALQQLQPLGELSQRRGSAIVRGQAKTKVTEAAE
jgi:hypothetical protein